MKHRKESLGGNLHDLEFGKGFLNMMSSEQVNNSKIDKLELNLNFLCIKEHYQEGKETAYILE